MQGHEGLRELEGLRKLEGTKDPITLPVVSTNPYLLVLRVQDSESWSLTG